MGKGVKTKKKNPGVGIDFKRAKHKVSISASSGLKSKSDVWLHCTATYCCHPTYFHTINSVYLDFDSYESYRSYTLHDDVGGCMCRWESVVIKNPHDADHHFHLGRLVRNWRGHRMRRTSTSDRAPSICLVRALPRTVRALLSAVVSSRSR